MMLCVQVNNPYAPPSTYSRSHRPLDASRSRPLSKFLIVFLGIVLPGLPAILMNRRVSGIALLVAIPASLGFFGPCWDLYLFDGTPYDQCGLYPFVLLCCVIPVLSVWHGLTVRRQILLMRVDSGAAYTSPLDV